MDKAKAPASVDSQSSAETYEPSFSNDDLGKLQNILLGDHARQTVDRIDTLEQALLGALDDMRAEFQERVGELDARIAAEADTRSKAMKNLTSRIDKDGAANASLLKDLTADLRSTENDMQQALDAAASGLTDELDMLRKSTGDLSTASADLNASKVDRAALADLLTAAVEGLQAGPASDS